MVFQSYKFELQCVRAKAFAAFALLSAISDEDTITAEDLRRYMGIYSIEKLKGL